MCKCVGYAEFYVALGLSQHVILFRRLTLKKRQIKRAQEEILPSLP